jgi:glycolate oxidase iron-sulfur subunit
MGSRLMRELLFLGGRALRFTGLAPAMVSVLGRVAVAGRLRFALAMLSATRRSVRLREVAIADAGASADRTTTVARPPIEVAGIVGVLRGCVQEGLYRRINDATARTLDVNGYDVRIVTRQDCCGALHAHGGALDAARRLAKKNIVAFEGAGVDWVVVSAAGCGATMKEYGVLFEGDPMEERAREFSTKVRDVSELLTATGPLSGASVSCTLAYDHPCHLIHAQGISSEPLEVLEAVPGVDVRVIAKADECCGGAGIYGMTHPDLGSRIGSDKVAAVREVGAELVCTPNPGCMMQIGAGLLVEGDSEEAVHPVEVLDESYKRAGYYR